MDIRPQRYFEDVEEESPLPSFTNEQSLKAIVRYAWGSNDLADVHYDYKKAIDRGLPDVFGQGAMTAGFMGKALADWHGPNGFVRRLSAQYRAFTIPGDVLTTHGVVVRKYQEDGEDLVECDIWVENQDGKRVTVGKAIVSLPSKEG